MGVKVRIAAVGLTALGRYIARISTQKGKIIDNATSSNPLNAKDGNPTDEDKRIQDWKDKQCKPMPVPPHKPERLSLSPMQRAVSSWSKSDLDSVMQSSDYQYDEHTQKKVKRYFDYKYPGPLRVDATGRPIND